MGRKCSQCGNNGHNSRTCSSAGSVEVRGSLRLLGVHLHVPCPTKKSFGVNCLSSSSYLLASSSSPPTSSSSSSLVCIEESSGKISNGYLSDGLMGRTQERKKGVPWTEEEHRAFLNGLENLGKGDWRGISRNFVTTRTPTQVASHAQKYFLRQSSFNKKKRRSSLFDVVRSSGRQVHVSDSCESKEPSSTYKLQFPYLSCNPKIDGVDGQTKIDLDLSQQATRMPSCLYLMPNCSASMSSLPSLVSQSSFLVAKSHVHHPPLNLELSISTPGLLDQNKSSPSSLFMGSIRVI